MRKLLLIVLVLITSFSAFSQTAKQKKNKEILNRSGDHLMLQFSYDMWLGAPDSIKNHIKGFHRGVNVYVMYNLPFKGDPRFSIAAGIGIGNSNIFFSKMNVDVSSNKVALPFIATDTLNNYKKYKLATTFLEVPIEFRFCSKPETPNKAVKVALGVKVGTLLNSHTKGKNLRTPLGVGITNSTDKITDKTFFNNTRVAATARIGYGNFTLFGAYNITSIFRPLAAADVKLLQVGITFSGL